MNKSNYQRRQTPLKNTRLEIRKEGEQEMIRGYAAVFYNPNDPGTEYWIWSDFVERIMPGAFDQAIADFHDARALFDHESQNLLGRVSAGTCILSVDEIGLLFEVPYDATDPDHQRVAAKIKRGDLTGCSFAMSGIAATWEEIPGDDETIISVRNITSLTLHDVGPVTWPAYTATEVGIRTALKDAGELVEARSIHSAHRDALLNRNLADELEVRMFEAREL